MIFGNDHKFWIAVGGAALFKVMTSPHHSLTRAVMTVLAGVFSAWVFTDSLLDIMGWSPETYRLPAAALVTLTGEGAMRWLISLTPERALEIWRDFRK
jgi:hypothetical protein